MAYNFRNGTCERINENFLSLTPRDGKNGYAVVFAGDVRLFGYEKIIQTYLIREIRDEIYILKGSKLI